MKQKTKALLCAIGMMAFTSPVALGQEADAIQFAPDSLHFTSESGCPAVYHVVDLAVMLRTCAPLSGEARDEAIQLLKEAMEDPELLGEYFELEYVGPDINLDDFTVIGLEQDDEDDEECDEQCDCLRRAYFSDYTIILEWEGAGYTSIDCRPEQTKQIHTLIDMYYVVRHEYEVSQTPKRDSR